MKFYFFFIIAVACTVKVSPYDIESKITDYFSSGTYKILKEQWQNQRKSFENALLLVLQENYGHRGMNVYVRKLPDSYKIADGFHFSDNVVDVVLMKMRLQELPFLVAPEVTFALASNVLHVQATLSKMIINTKYLLMRNQTDVVFSGPDKDPYQKSPFSFQQVQDSGDLTIVADYCFLTGHVITTLSGESVNLGHDTFKVTDCKFSIEIFSEKVGSPPVLSPYFSKEQSQVLETMLATPVRGELVPKLQASVYSYVNTSAIFGSQLPELRYKQHKIFDETSKHMAELVKNFVKNTIKANQGTLQLKPLKISWNGTCLEETCMSSMSLKDVVLYGVDTAYSAHSGGPFKLHSTKVAEAIRFSTMQIRGKGSIENATVKGEYDFAVELRDVAVSVEMEAKSSSSVMVPTKLYLTGWRTYEFSTIEFETFARGRIVLQSFVTGYLINEIPKRLLTLGLKSFGNNKETNSDNVKMGNMKEDSEFEYFISKEGTNEDISGYSDENRSVGERSGKKTKDAPNALHLSENENLSKHEKPVEHGVDALTISQYLLAGCLDTGQAYH